MRKLIFGVLAAAAVPARTLPPQMLVVLSEADRVALKNGKSHPTGYYLSELIVPVHEVAKLGYRITIATPKGQKPTLDASSDAARFFKNEAEYKKLRRAHDALPGLKTPAALATMTEDDLAGFDAVFFPGGHAPLTDLTKSLEVDRVLRHFHAQEKPTALICHGPAALLAASGPNMPWLYRNYRMTAFSTAEEKQAEGGALGGEVEYYLDDALRSAGADVAVVAPWRPMAVRDRELITGQNPQSDADLTRELLIALAEVRLKNAPNRAAYRPDLTDLDGATTYEVSPFPKDWRDGFTNVYIGARRPGVSRALFFKTLVPHLAHAQSVYGPAGMRGYLVLSNGDYEIAFMNWSSEAVFKAAGSVPGGEAVFKESAPILETLALFRVPSPEKLKHPALP